MNKTINLFIVGSGLSCIRQVSGRGRGHYVLAGYEDHQPSTLRTQVSIEGVPLEIFSVAEIHFMVI